MHPDRKRRLLQALGLTVVGSLFALLVIFALIQDTGAFVSPSDLTESPRTPGTRLSVGGWVVAGSWQREQLQHRFTLADADAQVQVLYRGLVPDLFTEGEAAMATGRWQSDGTLLADTVLARHDENYRPPGVDPLPPGRAGEYSGR